MIFIGRILKLIWHGLGISLVAISVVLMLLLVGVRIIGLTPYTVLSGSMEPQYHVGSVIYIKEVDPQTLSVGDPITFRLVNGTVVTHRIEEIMTENGLYFRTKGDANNISDSPIEASSIMGKPVFSIPLLGFVANFIQNPPGTYITIGVGSLAVILFTLEELLTMNKKEKQNDTEEK